VRTGTGAHIVSRVAAVAPPAPARDAGERRAPLQPRAAHAERREDTCAQVRLVAVARERRDQPAQQVVARVAVRPPLARREGERQAGHLGEHVARPVVGL
jgi:hypothetical protein